MDPMQRRAHENAALALIGARNLPGAEARLHAILAAKPDDARALALLSLCKAMADDRKAALETARAAAAADPDDPWVRRALSSALLSDNKFEEAEALARGLVADDPADSQALFRLALARLAQEDGAYEANELFARAEASAGDDVAAIMNLAHLKLSQWRWDEAAALAQRALALDPTIGDTFLVLGECALAQKRPHDAYDLALEALRLEPGEKQTLRLLARARARRDVLLRPFLPFVDWIVEMDVQGLALFPLIALPLVYFLFQSIALDYQLLLAGGRPLGLVSLLLLCALVYAGVAYCTALSARLEIRRDLKRLALPNF